MMGKHFAFDSVMGKDFLGKDYFSMFSKPAVFSTGADLIVNMVPIWTAIAIGLVVGWSWKPRWVSFVVLGMRHRQRIFWSAPPGLGARRIWLALTAITAFPYLRDVWSKFRSWMWPQTPEQSEVLQRLDSLCGFPDEEGETKEWALTTDDLVDFAKRVECKDGGLEWNKLMERSTEGMVYEAWRREPRDGVGPTEYKSRTIFENVSPVEMRDFFWDDDFRCEWDDMLISSRTWEVCPSTGSMVVQWVRKFPVFCKDREYTIGRRIWFTEDAFYCVTKGIHYPRVPRHSFPRRVDHYFSSWCIRAVDSGRGDANQTSCEVWLFHHEDMGIQRDLAKLGIRQGMWGCVKKMGPGIKKYQAHRRQRGKNLSRSALMADVTTRVPTSLVKTFSLNSSSSKSLSRKSSSSKDLSRSENSSPLDENKAAIQPGERPSKSGHLRWFILGSVVALACGVDKGSVGKVLVFGLARGLDKMTERRRVR